MQYYAGFYIVSLNLFKLHKFLVKRSFVSVTGHTIYTVYPVRSLPPHRCQFSLLFSYQILESFEDEALVALQIVTKTFFVSYIKAQKELCTQLAYCGSLIGLQSRPSSTSLAIYRYATISNLHNSSRIPVGPKTIYPL